jgi:hypothetical protein
MPDIKSLYPSKYLSAADLKGQEVTCQIAKIKMEQMSDGEEKPVLYFVGAEKAMVLNKTNARTIAQLHGDDYDVWPGKRIILFAVPVEFGGQMTMGVRVKPSSGPYPDPPAQDDVPEVKSDLVERIPGENNPDDTPDSDIPF